MSEVITENITTEDFLDQTIGEIASDLNTKDCSIKVVDYVGAIGERVTIIVSVGDNSGDVLLDIAKEEFGIELYQGQEDD